MKVEKYKTLLSGEEHERMHDSIATLLESKMTHRKIKRHKDDCL